MANTTFSGPVRSETTFKAVSKNATTGAITKLLLLVRHLLALLMRT